MLTIDYAFRSLLFVPGDSSKKLAKARGLRVDALIIDWEDAVSDERKARARTITRDALEGCPDQGPVILIRPNPPGSPAFEADIESLGAMAPAGVVLPKCGSVSEVEHFIGMLPAQTRVVPLLESAAGVQHAYAIAQCSERVPALLFGAEDYSAEIGIQRSPGEPELAFARGAVVNSARAAGREVFDSPLMQFEDLDLVREAANRARRLGFTGKAAIHPGQLAPIHEAFRPSDEEIAEARATISRFESHGGGVYAVDGALEDKPAIVAALRVLQGLREPV